MNIYQKLVEVRKRVTGLSKDAKTNFGEKFKYVSSNNILSVIRPAMDEQGLVLECRVTGHDMNTKWSGSERKEHLTQLDVEFVWVNADKPDEKIVCPFYGQGLDTGEKGVGKALTYAEKYFLLKFFNIPTDEDDPDGGSPERNGNGRSGSYKRAETPADDIQNAQYNADGTPANAAAERHAQAPVYILAEAAESKLLTLMDALEMPDDMRRAAFATVTDGDAARALKADLEQQLKDKQEAVA